MNQVITFNKSLLERLQEYNDSIFGEQKVPVNSIQKEWAFYLELTMDPIGWQAVWKIPLKTCEFLQIPYPSVVLVYVLEVIFRDLTAIVKVIAVQDDIVVPEKHTVPLIQLWITKKQDKSIALNIDTTANVLDMLRFFYNNILMPWDFEDDNCQDWSENHLVSRLKLYYDTKNGVLPISLSENIKSLISEAKMIKKKQEILEEKIELLKENDVELDINNKDFEELLQLNIRMMKIKQKINFLEDPFLKQIIIKRYQQNENVEDPKEQTVWLIFEKGMPDDYIQFLETIKINYPNKIMKFIYPLHVALSNGNPNDIYILSESTIHTVVSSGALEKGGILRGLSDRNKTILTTNNGQTMLDFNGDLIILENFTAKAITPICTIIVRRGKVIINNCHLIGDGKSSVHQGIIVLSGATLELNNCELSYFYTGIVGNDGSTIVINNSKINNNNFGLKLFDNCKVSIQNSIIESCSDYGICLETNNFNDEYSTAGTFEILNNLPNLNFNLIEGKNNTKGDVIINKKETLQPFEDLFGNPDVDISVCEKSDMEISNPDE